MHCCVFALGGCLSCTHFWERDTRWLQIALSPRTDCELCFPRVCNSSFDLLETSKQPIISHVPCAISFFCPVLKNRKKHHPKQPSRHQRFFQTSSPPTSQEVCQSILRTTPYRPGIPCRPMERLRRSRVAGRGATRDAGPRRSALEAATFPEDAQPNQRVHRWNQLLLGVKQDGKLKGNIITVQEKHQMLLGGFHMLWCGSRCENNYYAPWPSGSLTEERLDGGSRPSQARHTWPTAWQLSTSRLEMIQLAPRGVAVIRSKKWFSSHLGVVLTSRIS